MTIYTTRLRGAAVAIALALATPLAAFAADGATADAAKGLLKAMTDYLVAQKTISFSYDSDLEVVTNEHQRLLLAASGTLSLNRPDKFRATRSAGFADTELLFDGKVVTLHGKNVNRYAQLEVPGTIDHLVDELREKHDIFLPAADVLSANPYDLLMTDVVDVKDLGSGVVGGVECDHLAFRAKEVDWQIWIAQGAHPYPCKYVITSKLVVGGPQYSVQVRDWKPAVRSNPKTSRSRHQPIPRRLS